MTCWRLFTYWVEDDNGNSIDLTTSPIAFDAGSIELTVDTRLADDVGAYSFTLFIENQMIDSDPNKYFNRAFTVDIAGSCIVESSVTVVPTATIASSIIVLKTDVSASSHMLAFTV